jgi:cytochrome c-type biogenesis protein CcmH
MRILATIAALLLLVVSPAHAQETVSPVLPDLEDEVMCPTCGTALGLSESPQASQIRALIRRLDAEGRSKEEIKDALVAEYGSEVLAVPETSGFDLAAWIIPGAAILIAAAALGVGVRRWRREPPGDGDKSAAATGGDPEAEQRLDADLERYEL